MSNAVYKTVTGDTLELVARKFYALLHADSTVDDTSQALVIEGIRDQTPTSLIDLSTYTDSATLPASSTLFIPTIRTVSRALLIDNSTLETDLLAKGLCSASRMLAYEDDEIEALLSPLSGYTSADITKAWVLTAFLNLDGMDPYTAEHLYEQESITSLASLASQSTASMDSILSTLTSTPHDRPGELATQGHSTRWPLEASIYTKTGISELLSARVFPIPKSAALASQQAASFEAMAADEDAPEADIELAGYLTRLYSFQDAVLRANNSVLAGQWEPAATAYQDARCHWHRLCEDLGVVSSVDDEDGLNLDTCSAVTKALLEKLPAGEEDLLDVSMHRRIRGTSGRSRFSGFTYDELKTDGTDEQQTLRTALSSKKVHELPKRLRRSLKRTGLRKDRSTLAGVSQDLVAGLTASGDAALARDMDSRDQERLLRNFGSTTVGKTYSGELDIFDSVGDKAVISELAPLMSGTWTNTKADDVLSTTAKSKYPSTGFLARSDVTPFTKFVVLPNVSGSSTDFHLPVTSNFVSNYRDDFLKPRLKATSGAELTFDDDCWFDTGAFAALCPFLYCFTIPLGLHRAYSHLQRADLARKHGSVRINFYDPSDGSLVRDVAGTTPSSLALDMPLAICSTSWPGEDALYSLAYAATLHEYVEHTIALAKSYYRRHDLDNARKYFNDAMCAIETSDPGIAAQARTAVAGLYRELHEAGSGSHSVVALQNRHSQLSIFNIKYKDGSTTKKVLEDVLMVVADPSKSKHVTLTEAKSAVESHFEWYAAPSYTEPAFDWDAARVSVEQRRLPVQGVRMGDFQVFFDASKEPDVQLFSQFCLCSAQTACIDAGQNWMGYREDYVPPWSFDHLYSEASRVCALAASAEQQMLSMLQLWEAAQEKEFLAGQQLEIARAQGGVAIAALNEQIAAAAMAEAQAAYAVEQAAATAGLSSIDSKAEEETATFNYNNYDSAEEYYEATGSIELDRADGSSYNHWSFHERGSTGIPFGGPTVSALFGLGSTEERHDFDMVVLGAASNAAAATAVWAEASVNRALAEYSASMLAFTQAVDYCRFLAGQQLNSGGYEILLSMATGLRDAYLEHAHRLAWLTQHALSHETQQHYGLVEVGGYAEADDVTDLMRAQTLQNHLESLRAAYVSGQSFRFQEVKWTVSLASICPGAWQEIREKGEANFVIRQRDIDRAFPGTYLHSLKDVRVEVVGLVPPTGAKGILYSPGVFQIRVPNTTEYQAGEFEPDWVTEALDGTASEYDEYAFKRVVTTLAALALSEFEVREDRVVLSSPAGMLKPVEHHGLNSGWTLKLHPMANDMDFEDIMDVEITFWFRCAYDRGLEEAQEAALTELGKNGDLLDNKRLSYRTDAPDSWSGFVSDPLEAESLDVRQLAVNVKTVESWKKNARVVDIMLGAPTIPEQDDDMKIRLLCSHHPPGVELTLDGTSRFLYSTLGTSLTGGNADLEDWIEDHLYDDPGTGAVPDKGPEATWVLKVQPASAATGWFELDDDGTETTTTSGPLQGMDTGTGLARYDDGTAWTNYRLRAKVAHRNGTYRLRVRDDGTDHYALEFDGTSGSNALKLLRVESGTDTQLGSTLSSWQFPDDEYLVIDMAVLDSSTGVELTVWIDGIKVFDAVSDTPTSGTLEDGTVGLEVVSTASSTPVDFDDVEVTRLYGWGGSAEQLLSEPFTSTLPTDWTFSTGDWSISSSGHKRLIMRTLVNLSLNVEYQYEMDLD